MRLVGPFTVNSFVGGKLEISPAYTGYKPNDCPPADPEGECPRCQRMHIAGFLNRMVLAERVEKLLNGLYAEAAKPPRVRERTR